MAVPNPFMDLPGLAARFDPLRAPVLVLCRNSLSGKRGRKGSIDDFMHNVALLKKQGINLAPFIPSRAQLDEMLRTAPAVVSVDLTGKRFTNRFVELDLRSQCGVYVLLSTGSARKLEADEMTQPWVKRAAATARTITPSLVFARRIDRIVRKAWALGPLMLALGDGWIGDGRRGIRQANAIESVFIFFDATVSEEEADKLVYKGPEGVSMSSGRWFDNGQVICGNGPEPPPGFGAARLSNGIGLGSQVWYLDDGVSAPSADRTAYGLSTVTLDGQPVSQVDNVRFVLTHLGRPGWHRPQVLDALEARRWSTVQLRRLHHDASKTWTRECDHRTLDTILEHLDVYRDGKIPVNLPDGWSFEIGNAFPVDGVGWATPEDFVRVERFREAGWERQDRLIRLVLAGLVATVDGAPGKLGTADRKPRTRPPSHYQVWERDQYKSLRSGLPLIDAMEVATAIVDGIVRARNLALDLVDVTPPDTPAIVEARNQERTAQDLVATLETQERTLIARCADPVLADSTLLVAVKDEYEKVAVDLRSARETLTAATTALQNEQRTAIVDLPQLRAEALLHLVEALRDPMNTLYASTLRHALGDSVTFDLDRRTKTWTVTGALTFGVDGHKGTVEFSRTWCYAAAPPAPYDIDKILDRIEAGELFTDVCPRYLMDVAIAASGQAPGDCLFVTCTDPRILRVGMAVTVRRRGRTNEQIATDLNEPVPLVNRTDSIWNGPLHNRIWRRHGRDAFRVRLHTAAATTADGIVPVPNPDRSALHQLIANTPADWERRLPLAARLAPCGHCGSYRRIPSLLREVDCSICVDCRRDRSGVEWPVDPYDGYVPHLDALKAAGLIAQTATPVPQRSPRDHSRPGRRPTDRTRYLYAHLEEPDVA